jgi:hypothetical protein
MPGGRLTPRQFKKQFEQRGEAIPSWAHTGCLPHLCAELTLSGAEHGKAHFRGLDNRVA